MTEHYTVKVMTHLYDYRKVCICQIEPDILTKDGRLNYFKMSSCTEVDIWQL